LTPPTEFAAASTAVSLERTKQVESIEFLTAKRQRTRREETRNAIEQIAKLLVDALLEEYRALGPGLLALRHQRCLPLELRGRDIEGNCEVVHGSQAGSSILLALLAPFAVNSFVHSDRLE
jgi:hypothetical protein